MSKETIEKSNKFADEKNLPRYEYVIHPRVTGFNYIFNQMYTNNQIDCVHDVTIGYRGGKMPERETDFLAGNLPEEIHFFIDKFSCEQIFEGKNDKTNNEILEDWICDRWKKKEESLKNFYQNKQEQIDLDYETKDNLTEKFTLTMYPLFWLLSLSLIFLFTYCSIFVRSFLLIALSFYLYQQFVSNNIDNFIINSFK